MKTFLSRYCQFLGQPESQQGAVATYSIAIVLFSIVMVSIMQGFYLGNKKEYQTQVELADWLHHSALRLEMSVRLDRNEDAALGAIKKENINNDSRTLVVLLSETAVENGLILARLEQRQAKVTLTLNKANFSDVMTWLDALEVDGIAADQVNITYVDKNIAEVILTFTED
mgnify:CR=1 FL=1